MLSDLFIQSVLKTIYNTTITIQTTTRNQMQWSNEQHHYNKDHMLTSAVLAVHRSRSDGRSEFSFSWYLFHSLGAVIRVMRDVQFHIHSLIAMCCSPTADQKIPRFTPRFSIYCVLFDNVVRCVNNRFWKCRWWYYINIRAGGTTTRVEQQ